MLPDNPHNITQWNTLIQNATDTSVLTIYASLLLKYPYLEEYWLAYSVAEYKVNGVDASISTLERACNAHPHSIDLWTGFLTAVISQNRDPTDVRSIYERAISLNGLHFNSHPLWDKCIQYEKSLAPNSPQLLSLYQRVVRAPLYQYAHYYKQFSDEAGLFEGVCEGPVDKYLYDIYASTQALVNDKWVYESKLTCQTFSLTDPTDVDEWIAYLDHEIQRQQPELVESLFERCLVPHCFNTRIWLKYVAYCNRYHGFERTQRVYEKASKVLVLTENTVRFSYARFLKRNNKEEEAQEYLVSLAKLFTKKNLKTQYLESVRELLNLQREEKNFKEMCKHIIGEYLKNKKNALGVDLTDESVCVVAKFYLERCSDEECREFYSTHYKIGAFQRSGFFWRFFMEKDMAVIQDMRTTSQLPKGVFDALIEHAYALVSANFVPCEESLLLTRDNDVARSLAENYAARRRMGRVERQVGHPGVVVEGMEVVEGGWVGLREPVVVEMPRRKKTF